jgi:hypothetical protein
MVVSPLVYPEGDSWWAGRSSSSLPSFRMRPGTRRYVQGEERLFLNLHRLRHLTFVLLSRSGAGVFLVRSTWEGGAGSYLHLYHSVSTSRSVKGIIIATTLSVLNHMNDPLAFGFQASTPLETFPDFIFSRAQMRIPACEGYFSRGFPPSHRRYQRK